MERMARQEAEAEWQEWPGQAARHSNSSSSGSPLVKIDKAMSLGSSHSNAFYFVIRI